MRTARPWSAMKHHVALVEKEHREVVVAVARVGAAAPKRETREMRAWETKAQDVSPRRRTQF
jgi:hypothetical protein